MFLNTADPLRVEAGERTAPTPPASIWSRLVRWEARYCTIFTISLTFTGFISSLIIAIYSLLHERSYIFFLIAAVLNLAMFVHLITSESNPLNVSRPVTAIPFHVATSDNFRSLLQRPQSERVQSSAPIRSLPTYILVPVETQEREESSSGGSTESTLSAESSQSRLDDDSSNLPAPPASQQPVTGGPLVSMDMTQAAQVIAQIVKQSLVENKVASEKSSECSTEGQTILDGIRQRKPSPMELQKHVPLSGGEQVA